MTRRQALLLLSTGLWSRGAGAVSPGAEFAEVAPGIHVRPGVHEDASAANDDAIANVGFIVGADSVAVIDPGGSRGDGERLRAAIRRITDLPIRYVILTHIHPDHIFGSPAFEADRPVFVSHARMPGVLFERGQWYKQHLAEVLGQEAAGDWAMPTLTVNDTGELDLGGRRLLLHAHGPAHTDNDLSVLDPQTGTLWAGDLLFVERAPSLDGSLPGWLRELDVLKSMPASRAVPGHGPPSVPWPGGAADCERYLTTLLRETRALIAEGGDIAAAPAKVAQSERGRWALFDEYNGHNTTAAFKELEWE